MKTETLNIYIDESLKREFEQVCEELGISPAAAIDSFIRTTVKERKIPFDIEMGKEPDNDLSEAGREIFELLRKQARENDLPEMTMEEIDEEISKCRHNKD